MDLSPRSLRQKFICSKHFTAAQVTSKKLPQDAIPAKYISESSSAESITHNENSPLLQVASTSRTYGAALRKKLFDQNPPDSSTSSDEYLKEIQKLPLVAIKKRKHNPGEEIEKLKIENEKLRKKNNNLQTQLNNAKKRILKIQLSAKLLFKDSPTVFSKCLLNMQLKHKGRSQWTPSEKKTALSLYYKSPSAYNYLRQKGIILPAISTIKKWLGNFNCCPGFSKRIFDQLSLKSTSMKPSERFCIVMFDEMSLKRKLEYSEKMDMIEGVADLGVFGRRAVPANQALVVMIRGIYSSWKIPIAYFVSEDGVNAKELTDIILLTLQKLEIVNLKPIGVVCDVSKVNQQFYKKLGVTVNKPFFLSEGKKYLAFYDVPHLLKCMRNNFLNNCFVYDGKFIQFSDIKKVYDIDSNSKTGKCLLKLTDKHLNPNSFEKMSVKLAAQLFSHSVAAAINVAVRTGELVSTTGLNTSYFVETINNLFDALNSNGFESSNPFRRVLSDKNPQVLKAINTGYELIEKLYKINKKGEPYRPPSFDGFLETINAVKTFHVQQKSHGFPYLFTGRLIQDPLENQFSIYRQKGGYNRNPTVKTFRAAFKLNLVTNLIRPAISANSGTNVDVDKSILSTKYNCIELLRKEEDEVITDESLDSDSSASTSSSFILSSEKFNLETCSTTYFAGYLIRKCLKKFKCSLCQECLEGIRDLENDDELLIFYKNYDLDNENRLKTPTELMKKFTQICLHFIGNNISKFITMAIFKRLEKSLFKILRKKVPAWENGIDSCREHRHYILKLLIRTLIFKYCKTISYSMKSRKGTKNFKLSILQHN